jgi:hypothetical protein
MKLKDIVVNSQYITDESVTDTVLVALTNGAIAHINTEVKCNLPFVTSDNLNAATYDAISNSWQLRLFEPFICFSISSNDNNDTARQFHFSRFLSALDSFIKNGLDSIKKTDESGEDTGYTGDSARIFEVDITNADLPGWF